MRDKRSRIEKTKKYFQSKQLLLIASLSALKYANLFSVPFATLLTTTARSTAKSQTKHNGNEAKKQKNTIFKGFTLMRNFFAHCYFEMNMIFLLSFFFVPPSLNLAFFSFSKTYVLMPTLGRKSCTDKGCSLLCSSYFASVAEEERQSREWEMK